MVNLSREIRRTLQEALSRAEKHYQAGDDSSAASSYEAAHRLALKLADHAPSRKLEDSYKRQALKYRRYAQALRQGIVPKTGSGGPAESGSAREEDASEIRQAVSHLLHTSKVTWEQIGGLDETKAEIKFALGMSLATPPAGVELAPWRNILFYGPPGTGKTLLAAATSNAMRLNEGEQAIFFNVKVSSVLSKYFGESSKILSELYGTARDASPAVVFLDEFESLCPSRDSEGTGAERRILSTLLAELDGLAEKGRSDIFVLTIAATNRPWDLDSAVLSRFEKKILIPLPDPHSRRAILGIHLEEHGFEVQAPWAELVRLTDGYTGREIERFSKEVTNRMIAEENRTIPELIDKGLQAMRNYQLKVRPLKLEDFQRAAAQITPQVNAEELERFQRWKRTMEE